MNVALCVRTAEKRWGDMFSVCTDLLTVKQEKKMYSSSVIPGLQ